MTKYNLNSVLKIPLFFYFNIIIIIHNKTSMVQASFKMNVGDPDQLCPAAGSTCSDGTPHYLCAAEKTGPSCSRFKQVKIDNKIRRTFVQGHNGIRNKLADDYDIANMNLVYWSPELSTMATEFVRKCHVGKDPCSLIGENKLIVNQNWSIRKRLIGGWPARVVRRWYVELGYGMRYENIAELRDKGQLGNFSQMLWPLLEFIGCTAAKINDFYFIVCFYYPSYDAKNYEKFIERGFPCSKCNPERRVCSKTFISLCGVDLQMDATSVNCANAGIFLASLFVVSLYRELFLHYL